MGSGSEPGRRAAIRIRIRTGSGIRAGIGAPRVGSQRCYWDRTAIRTGIGLGLGLGSDREWDWNVGNGIGTGIRAGI